MNELRLTAMPVGPLQTNAYLLADAAAGEALLVDPGDEPDTLLAAIRDSGCRLVGLLATHGHFDHVGAAAAVGAAWDLPLLCHPAAEPLVRLLPQMQQAWGFPPSAVPRLEPSLTDGHQLALAGRTLLVRHAPGHSPGHVIVVAGQDVLVGDLIFAGSVGRTDLPGGDQARLEDSIRRLVYTLPDSCRLHPGHGPSTTVAREKASNPYVRPL